MTDTAQYKIKLETLLDTVITDLESIATYDKATGDWQAIPTGTEVGEADANVEADVVEEWNERRAIVSQLETRFNNIKRALKKIEDGTYGACIECEKPIAPKRLELFPYASRCLSCQETFEEG